MSDESNRPRHDRKPDVPEFRDVSFYHDVARTSFYHDIARTAIAQELKANIELPKHLPYWMIILLKQLG